MKSVSPARPSAAVLYFTIDGVLEPIGQSQVLKPILELAARGVPYVLVSLERSADLSDGDRLTQTQALLSAAGVTWHWGKYRQSPGLIGVMGNLVRLWRIGARAAARHPITLYHARGPVPAALARFLPRRPLLFDFRGYVIDERIDAGRWFHNKLLLRVARRVERWVFDRAVAAVSLTELAASDVRAGRFGPWPDSKPVVVIPTCVDFDLFALPRNSGVIPHDIAQRLEGRLVVGFIGSLNASYRVSEALTLFAHLKRRRADAHLLGLTRQLEPLRVLLREHGVADGDFTLCAADPRSMPAWLSHVDWGLHLLEQTEAKRASMPTKLAEFFASGVRPVHFGCNEEVTEWVERAGSGVVLASTQMAELERAAQIVAEAEREPEDLDRARRVTRSHFDLHSGVDRYEALLRGLYPSFGS
jgi:glycosyltransferase involved in cell wall biosynthesis